MYATLSTLLPKIFVLSLIFILLNYPLYAHGGGSSGGGGGGGHSSNLGGGGGWGNGSDSTFGIPFNDNSYSNDDYYTPDDQSSTNYYYNK
jgi:hypothetical protein